MTRLRTFASRTYRDLVVLFDSEDEPEVSQELTPTEGATVISPPLPAPEPLMLLLIASLVWSLELD